MKKVILFFSFLFGILIMPATITAQNCKMCGDWIGTYTIQIPDPDPDGGMIDQNMKMFIRIKQHGEDMSVRVKTTPVTNSNDIKYWSDCEITSATVNSLSFTSIVNDDYDWNSNDRKNGRIINSSTCYCICIINYYSGKMVLSRHFHVDYYDKNGYQIDGRDFGHETITLYQEDNDW